MSLWLALSVRMEHIAALIIDDERFEHADLPCALCLRHAKMSKVCSNVNVHCCWQAASRPWHQTSPKNYAYFFCVYPTTDGLISYSLCVHGRKLGKYAPLYMDGRATGSS